ncbi:pyruvoyl-dependent arginine decarboxylase [Nocardioides sp.]|uniref:pyruvoyl-dependent arginine decarboxylase n=1 Tax=Nocardioides sp. TaxID=35761 RepID=UPI00273699A6|nr:pyruvoyl-dependent arginine decarboxylase [Nocardioides sp.]MDP3890947.1 pyruvoyl-dependent arginine decarboxylase [Nocardioides sp.]
MSEARLRITVRTATGVGRTPISAFDDALHGAGVADFNLLTLSSVIPPRSDVVRTDAPLVSQHGDKLYCVVAAAHSELRGESAWAGLGWVYDEPLGGLFVEHHSGSKESVEELIDMSLGDMVRRRGRDAGAVDRVVTGAHCTDQPVCALVVATYAVESWEAARG